MAEDSPYMEAMKEKDVEVLFCYEQYDDLTMLQLGQFDKKNLKSIENAVQVCLGGVDKKAVLMFVLQLWC